MTLWQARRPADALISEGPEGLLQLCVDAATEKLQRSNSTTMTPWLPSTVATISSHYFRECIKGAESKGIDVNALLQAAGVDRSTLDDPGARSDTLAMANLVQQVWYSMDDEFMGFTEHRAKVGLFGLMARFLVPCESLEQVLLAGSRFYNLVRTDVYLGLSVEGCRASRGVELSSLWSQPLTRGSTIEDGTAVSLKMEFVGFCLTNFGI